jgi:hypothetical protein
VNNLKPRRQGEKTGEVEIFFSLGAFYDFASLREMLLLCVASDVGLALDEREPSLY